MKRSGGYFGSQGYLGITSTPRFTILKWRGSLRVRKWILLPLDVDFLVFPYSLFYPSTFRLEFLPFHIPIRMKGRQVVSSAFPNTIGKLQANYTIYIVTFKLCGFRFCCICLWLSNYLKFGKHIFNRFMLIHQNLFNITWKWKWIFITSNFYLNIMKSTRSKCPRESTCHGNLSYCDFPFYNYSCKFKSMVRIS